MTRKFRRSHLSKKARAAMADEKRLHSQFWDLCKRNKFSVQEVEKYISDYGSSAEARMLLTWYTEKTESFKLQKTEIVRRIKQAEHIAEINEAEIEGKFILEIEAKIMKLNMVLYTLKEVEQIEESLNQLMVEDKKSDIKKLNEEMLLNSQELNQLMAEEKIMEKLNEEMFLTNHGLETKEATRDYKYEQKKLETNKEMYAKKMNRNIQRIKAEKRREQIQESVRQLMVVGEKKASMKKVMEKINEATRDYQYEQKKLETNKEMYAKKMNRSLKRMKAKKRRVERKEAEKEIMKEIQKRIESDYRKMTRVELTEKLIEAEDIMKKVKEAKNREKIKETEIIKIIKNVIEEEYLERMVAEMMRNELARFLNIKNIKELDEENTSTMAAGSTSRTKHPKIGTVRLAACELFNASMERCNFNVVKQQALIVSCAKEEYDDYTCGNVLRIWPELKKKGTKLRGPKDVGEKIIRNLQPSDMIEGTPSLHSVGFITFKISGKWMAKRIHRMLIEGIETWAPLVSLERVIVDFPIFDKAEGMHMDMLRRRYISRSLTRMFEYCQVHVLNNVHQASFENFVRNIIKIEDGGEGLTIYYNDEGKVKSVIFNSSMASDRGNAWQDLAALWHGAELGAQWLLFVTPVAKEEYVKKCFNAAKGAGWLSTALPLEPCATYVGYRSCTTKVEKLVYMLNKAKALHKVASFVLQGNAAEYTARDVLECAIQYTLLKTHRMANCTFDVDEILHEEGNTFLYLLKTKARILSITNKSRRDICELKKATLILEKDDALEQGEERDLGFHILDLTEVLVESCFPVLPHNLCKYLYDLCQIFNRYFVSTLARGRRSRFFLLLCEATAVVMQNCFDLLDITPQPLKNELGVTPLIYAAQLSVERPINLKELEDASAPVGRDPPKIQNPRFEPFSILLRINPNFESDAKLVKLFGYIDITDTCGLRSDGWTSTHRPDVSYIDLFRRPWNDPIEIINGGCASFGNPSCSRSLPLSSQMRIAMNLVAINEEENDFFPICNTQFDKDFSTFLASKLDAMCAQSSLVSEVGKVQINYILLKDAVDATLEVTFKTSLQNLEVCGAIDACYEGGFPLKCGAFEKTFYTTSLFELDSPYILKSGPIKLHKSRMAVPRKGSLKVKAHLTEGKSRNVILSDSYNFRSQTKDSIEKYLEGTNCSLEVKVTWSYCQGS